MAGLAALPSFARSVVVKADGLAGGTGVVVAAGEGEAAAVLTAFLEDDALGAAGRTVLLEERLDGREVAVAAFCDGATLRPLPPLRPSKRALDGDRGPNTPGMGACVPGAGAGAETSDRLADLQMAPVVRALSERGMPFRGVLSTGVMLTADSPKVLDLNARFGDPDAQALLPVLGTDLAEVLAAVAAGRLGDQPPLGTPTGAAVVLAAAGYPGPVATGAPIAGLDHVPDDVLVFHNATRLAGGRTVTAGGRVLTVVGRGPDLAAARERAYAGAGAIAFPGRYVRRDVALA